MGCNKISMLVTILMVLLSTTILLSEAQQTPACAMKLTPCADYMNSTNPPSTCCTPLKDAVENEIDCLCDLFNTPNLLESFGINRTQALQLPKHCGMSGDLSACNKVEAPPPTTLTPGGGASGAARIAWSGFPGLLLIWASMMLF